MDDLKPCPFCGSYPKQRSVAEDYHTVWCDNDDCPERPEILGETMQSAINSWNTRPIEDKLQARITDYLAGNAELVEKVEQLEIKNQRLRECIKKKAHKQSIFVRLHGMTNLRLLEAQEEIGRLNAIINSMRETTTTEGSSVVYVSSQWRKE